MHVLGDLSVAEFLRDYWQKKPVLIRNAWPGFQPLLSSDELAGLSLEEEIESRIVQEEGRDGPWTIQRGPFTEDDYRQLPESHWTLLVQAVDHWIPDAADLLEHFRFIPGWRIDDLMISYAVDGGSVGPHYDQYDVFLLQAAGQREWRIGQMCSEQSPILQGPKIRVLEDFAETDRWLLNPGDMLYLPPQLAHYGIARGECMTYSVGFRAPSLAELAQATLDDIIAGSTEDQRYTDADLKVPKNPGLIDADAARRLRTLLTSALAEDEILQQIIGKLMTEPKYPEHIPDYADGAGTDSDRETITSCPHWRKAEFARFAYSSHDDHCRFYALGQSWILSSADEPLVAYLANNSHYDSELLVAMSGSEEAGILLTTLLQRQMIYSPEADFGD